MAVNSLSEIYVIIECKLTILFAGFSDFLTMDITLVRLNGGVEGLRVMVVKPMHGRSSYGNCHLDLSYF